MYKIICKTAKLQVNFEIALDKINYGVLLELNTSSLNTNDWINEI